MPKKCESDARPEARARPARSRRASQTVSTTGPASRRPARRRTAWSRNDDVEARVVRDEDGLPGERQEPLRRDARIGGSTQSARVDPGERRDLERQPLARVDERLERSGELEALDPDAPISQMRERVGERPVVSRSTTQNVGVLEEDALGVCRLEGDAPAAPRETCVPRDDVVEQRARHALREVGEREQRPRRVLDRHGAATLLHELDKSISGIQPQLHGRILGERMFVRNQKEGRSSGGPSFRRRGRA